MTRWNLGVKSVDSISFRGADKLVYETIVGHGLNKDNSSLQKKETRSFLNSSRYLAHDESQNAVLFESSILSSASP